MKLHMMAIAIGMSLVLGNAQAKYRFYPHQIDPNQMQYKSSRSMYHMNMHKYKTDRKVHHHRFAIDRDRKAQMRLPPGHYYAKHRWHGRYNNHPIHPGLNEHAYRLHWQWHRGGYVPHTALISGYSHGYPYFMCRAKVHNKIVVGKLYAGRGCYVQYGGKTYVRGQYVVLVR